MGRSYWFECLKCGYRANVSGCADRGHDFYVQTIHCLDCHELYDAVTRLRVPIAGQSAFRTPHSPLRTPFLPKSKIENQKSKILCPSAPRPINPLIQQSTNPYPAAPAFQAALNRLPAAGIRHFTWTSFKPQCPVNPSHRVKPWSHLQPCPRCGLHLEKNPLPYRIWD